MPGPVPAGDVRVRRSGSGHVGDDAESLVERAAAGYPALRMNNTYWRKPGTWLFANVLAAQLSHNHIP
jgi:hypothetical protein